jgi:hypothetical protein
MGEILWGLGNSGWKFLPVKKKRDFKAFCGVLSGWGLALDVCVICSARKLMLDLEESHAAVFCSIGGTHWAKT